MAEAAPFLVATGLFVAALARSVWKSGVRRVGDASAYEAIAAQMLDANTLLKRPPLYPLLMRALHGNETLLIGLQAVIYAAAWIFFAATLYRLLPRAAAVCLALLTYYFALYPDFAGWAPIVLTESLAASLTVISVALLIRLGAGAPVRNLVALVLVCFAGSQLRDIGGAAALLLAMPVALLMAVRQIGFRAGAATIGGLAACCLLVAITAGQPLQGDPMAGRWVFPLLNTIGQRILPDAGATRYFVQAGMPVTPALTAMTNEVAPGKHWAFYRDPELAPFRHWLLKHGRATYLRLVAESPVKSAETLVDHRADLLDLGGSDSFAIYRGPQAGAAWLPRIDLIYVYFFGLIGAVLLLAVGRRQQPAATGAALCLSVYAGLPVLAALVYFGDAMEVARHALILPLYAVLLALTVLTLGIRQATDTRLP